MANEKKWYEKAYEWILEGEAALQVRNFERARTCFLKPLEIGEEALRDKPEYSIEHHIYYGYGDTMNFNLGWIAYIENDLERARLHVEACGRYINDRGTLGEDAEVLHILPELYSVWELFEEDYMFLGEYIDWANEVLGEIDIRGIGRVS